MKLGFQSAILADLGFEEVIDFAAVNAFECVELMCWPKGASERKYAGVTHVDVTDFTPAKANYYLDYAAGKGVEISALGYYPNPLSPDMEEAEIAVTHIKRVIDAAAMMGLKVVNTFVGNDWTKSVDDNWPRFIETWKPLLAHAGAKGIKVGIENCAMYFTADEWPSGKNLARSPAIWRRMFADMGVDHFGLNYDPSHFVWMQMDYMKPLTEFASRIFHAHAKDVRVDHAKLDDLGTMALPLEYHDPCIPGEGDIDWGKYVSGLKASGFDGAFCIEVEDKNYEDSLASRKKALLLARDHLRQFM